jgi:hypothetical protein
MVAVPQTGRMAEADPMPAASRTVSSFYGRGGPSRNAPMGRQAVAIPQNSRSPTPRIGMTQRNKTACCVPLVRASRPSGTWLALEKTGGVPVETYRRCPQTG